jgi:hypothetical protein
MTRSWTFGELIEGKAGRFREQMIEAFVSELGRVSDTQSRWRLR